MDPRSITILIQPVGEFNFLLSIDYLVDNSIKAQIEI